MLRTLSLAAPVVAAIMIVVLIIEPPALRPAERLPTLRMLTARAAEGLDQRQVQDAIARGREGEPGSCTRRFFGLRGQHMRGSRPVDR